MLSTDLFTGQRVRLTAAEPKEIAAAFNRWQRNSEYNRMLGTDPAYPYSVKAVEKWIDDDLFKDPPPFLMFIIRTLEDNRMIGEIGLDGYSFQHGDTSVGISIGDPQDWSQGYGGDAMHLILRYAFMELDLQRVSLTVFEYNPRAIRSYEKCGFVVEGRLRGLLNREGRRWDLLNMAVLRSDWIDRSLS